MLPPHPYPPPTPALSLLSPWEVLQLKVAHVPMGKMTRDAGIPNFVQDSATVSPSPVGMWRFMWYFCRCVYLELVEQEGHLIRLTLRDRQYRNFWLRMLLREAAESTVLAGCRYPIEGFGTVRTHMVTNPLLLSESQLYSFSFWPWTRFLVSAGIWGSH